VREIARSVGQGERVRPCRNQPNLGAEGLACLVVERGKHIGLGCPEPVIEGLEELGAELRRDDSASSPVGGVGPTLDQLGRLEIVEEVGHDCSVDTEVLGQGKLAANGALSRCGKDLVTPRAAGKVGDRGVRGRGVRPQDHAQAPSEVACQRADAARGVPNFATVTMGFIHQPIIVHRSAAYEILCYTDDLLSIELSNGSANGT
jgi:hypothetical protein